MNHRTAPLTSNCERDTIPFSVLPHPGKPYTIVARLGKNAIGEPSKPTGKSDSQRALNFLLPGIHAGTGRAGGRQMALDFDAQEFVDLDNDALEDVGRGSIWFSMSSAATSRSGLRA